MKISIFKKSEKQVLSVLTWACFIKSLKEIGAAGKNPYILKRFFLTTFYTNPYIFDGKMRDTMLTLNDHKILNR